MEEFRFSRRFVVNVDPVRSEVLALVAVLTLHGFRDLRFLQNSEVVVFIKWKFDVPADNPHHLPFCS
jgi:hypothetical protein